VFLSILGMGSGPSLDLMPSRDVGSRALGHDMAEIALHPVNDQGENGWLKVY
jgi:hypothetical protein